MKAEVHSVSEHWVSLKVRINGEPLIAQYHSHDCIWDDGKLLGVKDEAKPFYVSRAPVEGGEIVDLTERQKSAIRR